MALIQTEHDEQVALFACIDAHLRHYPDLALAFAVPNGGFRAMCTAVRLKAEGVRAGVPDILLPVSRRGYLGLALELKTRTGVVSAQQEWWLSQLKRHGWRTEVCRGWEAAWDTLREYLEGNVKGHDGNGRSESDRNR